MSKGINSKYFNDIKKMNVEVEFFKQGEKKLVVLRKLQGEGRDFEASIIYENEYDTVFKDLSKVNRQIEKNYKEYLRVEVM